MENKNIIIYILVLAGLAIFFWPKTQDVTINKLGDVLIVNFYDENGVKLNSDTLYSHQSTVGNIQGIKYMNFDVNVKNTGTEEINNVRIKEATPLELQQALADATAVPEMSVGESHKWSSEMIEVQQFEGKTTTFGVDIAYDIAEGKTTTVNFDQGTEKDLVVQQDVCEGGVPWNTCDPSNKPKYCDGGDLVNKASVCGCPSGYTPSGDLCTPTTCSDGTITSQCTANKPSYCGADKLIVNNCQQCGCPNDYYGTLKICQLDGSCKAKDYKVDFVITLGNN